MWSVLSQTKNAESQENDQPDTELVRDTWDRFQVDPQASTSPQLHAGESLLPALSPLESAPWADRACPSSDPSPRPHPEGSKRGSRVTARTQAEMGSGWEALL